MKKKINEGNGTLNSAEFKAVVDRLNRKESELVEISRLLDDEKKVGESKVPEECKCHSKCKQDRQQGCRCLKKGC